MDVLLPWIFFIFPSMTSISLMGTPLLVTDYDGLAARCLEWTRRPGCLAMEFVNTQVVVMRRHDPGFCKMTDCFDYFLPDGMPLVWCLNLGGAGLKDRIYGPIFMRRFLETIPAGHTHYLLGGSGDCAAKLRERFQRTNPNVQFAGGFHGICNREGQLEGEAEHSVIEEINRLSPDFIWVGFGTPKQQAWVHRHQHLLRRGVILSVGFAFDVNAGTKPDSPGWMQRAGLTWLHRMASEPRRLIPRYIRYNSLFMFYLAVDSLRRKLFVTGP